MLKTTLIYTLLLSGSATASAQRLMQDNFTIPSTAPSIGLVVIVEPIPPTSSGTSPVSVPIPTVTPTATPTSSPTTLPTFVPSVSSTSNPISSPLLLPSRIFGPPSAVNSTIPSFVAPYPTFTTRSPSGYYYRPTYPPRPTTPINYYYAPTEPPEAKTASLDASGIIIIILVLVTIMGICYGRSQFDQGMNAEVVDHFIDNIYKNKWFVIKVPKKLTLDRKQIAYKPCILFFSTRIKMKWVKSLAILQFVLGWIACISSLVGFIQPDNTSNNNIGAASLFLSELVLHIWYGYIRYWNPSWLFLQCDPDWELDLAYASASLVEARKSCTQLFHVDREYVERETSQWIIILGHVVSVPLHIGSIIGSCMACFALSVLAMVGCNKGGFQANIRMVGIISAVIGSLAYPILFRRGDVFLKVFASVGHHICLECYEARHFAKSSKQFIKSVGLKPFGDILGGDGDTDVELPEKPDLDQKDDEKVPAPQKNEKRRDCSNDEVNGNEDSDVSGNTLFSSSSSDDANEDHIKETKLSDKNDTKECRDSANFGTDGSPREEVEKDIDLTSPNNVDEGCRGDTSEKDEAEVDIEVGGAVDTSDMNEGKELSDDKADLESSNMADEVEDIEIGDEGLDDEVVIDGEDTTKSTKVDI